MIVRSAGGYIVEYKSPVTIFGLPLVHVAAGVDPVTMTPRVARGIIAVGGVAFGAVAIGGVAFGLLSSVGALTR